MIWVLTWVGRILVNTARDKILIPMLPMLKLKAHSGSHALFLNLKIYFYSKFSQDCWVSCVQLYAEKRDTMFSIIYIISKIGIMQCYYFAIKWKTKNTTLSEQVQNTIQLWHFIACDIMFYGTLKSNTNLGPLHAISRFMEHLKAISTEANGGGWYCF